MFTDRSAEVTMRLREAATIALEDAGAELLRTANETVPYREGVLKSSGEVRPAGYLKIQVIYGGEASAYAVKQHEDTTLSHPGGGRAKWLELAAKENAQRLFAEIAESIRGATS